MIIFSRKCWIQNVAQHHKWMFSLGKLHINCPASKLFTTKKAPKVLTWLSFVWNVVIHETATLALSHANFFFFFLLLLLLLLFRRILLSRNWFEFDAVSFLKGCACVECGNDERQPTMLTVTTRDGLIEFYYMSPMYKTYLHKVHAIFNFPRFSLAGCCCHCCYWFFGVLLSSDMTLLLLMYFALLHAIHCPSLDFWVSFFPSRRRNENMFGIDSIRWKRARKNEKRLVRIAAMQNKCLNTVVQATNDTSNKKATHTKRRIIP